MPSRELLYAQSSPDIGPLAIITVINLSAHSRVSEGLDSHASVMSHRQRIGRDADAAHCAAHKHLFANGKMLSAHCQSRTWKGEGGPF